MRGINKVIIVGTLGADPDVKQFPNGGSVTNISVATSEQWNDKQTGERREATEWHRISLHNKLGEIAAQYLRKGRQVYIEGSLRTRKYQDQTGQDRYITEIRADQMQMLGGNPAGQMAYQGGDTMQGQGGFGNNYNNYGNNGGYQTGGAYNGGTHDPQYGSFNHGGFGSPNAYQNGGNQSQVGFNQNAGLQPQANTVSQSTPNFGVDNSFANNAPSTAESNPPKNANPTTPTTPTTPKAGAVDDDIPF